MAGFFELLRERIGMGLPLVAINRRGTDGARDHALGGAANRLKESVP